MVSPEPTPVTVLFNVTTDPFVDVTYVPVGIALALVVSVTVIPTETTTEENVIVLPDAVAADVTAVRAKLITSPFNTPGVNTALLIAISVPDVTLDTVVPVVIEPGFDISETTNPDKIPVVEANVRLVDPAGIADVVTPVIVTGELKSVLVIRVSRILTDKNPKLLCTRISDSIAVISV